MKKSGPNTRFSLAMAPPCSTPAIPAVIQAHGLYQLGLPWKSSEVTPQIRLEKTKKLPVYYFCMNHL